MSDYFQDEPQLPVPETKGKKGLWLVLFVASVIILIIVLIKAGASTKDPKKAVVDVANADRSEIGEQTSKSTQDVTDQMVASDGTIQSQIGSVDGFLEKSIEKNTELANEERLANSRRVGVSTNLPSSIDAHGHPVTVTSQSSAEKNFVIPKLAEGWDPEQEIVVSATDQTPAYRYRPAYLRGSNNAHLPCDLERLDNEWLKSVGSPSYGHSLQVNDAFNAGMAPVAIKHSAHNIQPIYINGYKGTKQQINHISIRSNVHKQWTIPAPGEIK